MNVLYYSTFLMSLHYSPTPLMSFQYFPTSYLRHEFTFQYCATFLMRLKYSPNPCEFPIFLYFPHAFPIFPYVQHKFVNISLSFPMLQYSPTFPYSHSDIPSRSPCQYSPTFLLHSSVTSNIPPGFQGSLSVFPTTISICFPYSP
jgi:hypothetical protein